jgi:excisionase family DNA binding protein
MNSIPNQAYFTASEVATLLLVSTNTVRVWANRGMLKTELTLGGHRRFPREEIVRMVQERQASSSPAEPETLRLLIIDDDEALASTLAQGIENAIPASIVSIATNGFAGGMLARTCDPQIILLDLRMPGMDGFETCKTLKTDEATRHIRIIGVSGLGSEEDRERIFSAGAEQLLQKPLRIRELVEALKEPISQSSL